jgi:hypothetical protein
LGVLKKYKTLYKSNGPSKVVSIYQSTWANFNNNNYIIFRNVEKFSPNFKKKRIVFQKEIKEFDGTFGEYILVCNNKL